ncbi:hypothetical protein ACTXY8_22695 [Pseudomonas aeruginosa]
MALKLNERYPGRFDNPSAEYPQGSFKNRTTPDAKDGSYLEKDWANDKEGFFQSLLSAAGITANGAVDAVGASQFFDALQALKQIQAGTAFTTAGSAGALTLAPTPAITAYVANQRLRVKFSQASTGTDTLNISGLGAKSIKQYDSTGAKVAAVFAVNQLADVEYDGTDFVLLDQLPYMFGASAEQTAFVAGGLKVNGSAWIASGSLEIGGRTGVAGTPFIGFNSGATPVDYDSRIMAFDGNGTPGGGQLLLQATATNVSGSLMAGTEVQAGTNVYAGAGSAIFKADGNIFGSIWDGGNLNSHITKLKALGYNQTWQNVTANRALATTYTNTTGRPIQVFVDLADNGIVGVVKFNIDGISWDSADIGGGNSYLALWSFVIPAGGRYSLSGGASIRIWLELR